jgi:hypothetical protein
MGDKFEKQRKTCFKSGGREEESNQWNRLLA